MSQSPKLEKIKQRMIPTIPSNAHNYSFSNNIRPQASINKKNNVRSKIKVLCVATGIILGGMLLYKIIIPKVVPSDDLSKRYINHTQKASSNIYFSDIDKSQKAVSLLRKGTPPLELANLPSYMKKKINDEDLKVYSITLFDDCAEDGDVVRVSVNNLNLGDVLLTNAGSTIYVPLSSGYNRLTVTGVKDGRGGITVTFQTSQGLFYSKVMQPGESVTMNCGVM